ncbi:MAG: SurA N-terminal domain-containing protein [Emcibacteraceae bacterium]|nr:SurA N-terminal domain-containing protein [Emcibacteraceae bacterium]
MFDFFRKGMGSMLAGALLVILIFSFALWGIGDPLSSLGSGEIAEVGEEKITPNELAISFDNEFRQFQQSAGDAVTKQIAVQIGLGNRAVTNLIQTKAYDVETANLGLRASNDDLRQYIEGIPLFQDGTGEFNRSFFDQYVNSQGFSNRDFEDILRDEMARNQLIQSLINNISAPEITATTLTKFSSEQRTSEILAIPASAMTGIGEVNDEILKTYYDENSENYMAPEYRDISYFEISANDIAEKINISEEEALAAYETRINDFTKEEERGFIQMLLDDQDAADIAYSELQNGKTFEEVIMDKTGDSAEDSTFGAQSRTDFSELYGEEAADLLFSAALNDYTSTIETGFGVYIFKLSAINAGSSEAYEDVKEKIISDLKIDRAIDALFDIRNVIDDELAAGAPIDSIADVIETTLKTVSNVSIEGMTPDGTASSELPLIVEFLDYSFQNQVGMELKLYEGISNKFYMLSVDNVLDSTLRDFVEVKTQVNTDWENSRRATLASEFATKITEEYSADENTEKTLADFQGMLPQLTVNEVTVGRSNQNNDVSSNIHRSIFSREVGTIEMIQASNGDGYVLIRIKSREFATDIEETAVNNTKIQIRSSYQNDLMGVYIAHLYDALPVILNNVNIQATLDQIAAPAE